MAFLFLSVSLATSTGGLFEMSDALKDKIHLSHEATMLEMAKGPSMSRRAATDHTTCEACIADGLWWNSRICVEAKTYEKQYFGLWGPGKYTVLQLTSARMSPPILSSKQRLHPHFINQFILFEKFAFLLPVFYPL
jgi:hypothetical protein